MMTLSKEFQFHFILKYVCEIILFLEAWMMLVFIYILVSKLLCCFTIVLWAAYGQNLRSLGDVPFLVFFGIALSFSTSLGRKYKPKHKQTNKQKEQQKLSVFLTFWVKNANSNFRKFMTSLQRKVKCSCSVAWDTVLELLILWARGG